MHICFLTHEYPKPGFPHGGIGTFIQNISRELVKHGISISVVGTNYTDDYEVENDHGVNIFRLPASPIKGLRFYIHYTNINKKLIEIHQQEPLTIVESPELGLAFIRKLSNVKYLIRLHGGHHFFAESEKRGLNWWKSFQERRSFIKADKIIGVSQYAVEHTSKYFSFGDKTAGVIFYPLNLKRFYHADPEKTIAGRIFFAGTICEKKGIRQLVQAMKLIKKIIPYAHLVIAGREWFFPQSKSSYSDYLKTFIDDSVKSSISFLGSLPNDQIPLEIEKAEVCCYPSHVETFGIVVTEAMTMGKPIVFTELGPGKEIIRHEDTGLLCNPLVAEDIAEKIIYMLTNKQKALEMGMKARIFALENFSMEKIIMENIQLYNAMI